MDKIKELDQIRKEKGYQYKIEVDGGINDTNYKLLESSNVDIAVMGSFITKRRAFQKNLDKLK